MRRTKSIRKSNTLLALTYLRANNVKKVFLLLSLFLGACSGGETGNSVSQTTPLQPEIEIEEREGEQTPPIQDQPEDSDSEENIEDNTNITPEEPPADSDDSNSEDSDADSSTNDSESIPPSSDSDNSSSNRPTEGDDSSPDLDLGAAQYEAQCESCHGIFGDGQPTGSSILSALQTNSVYSSISQTMPILSPETCDTDCAANIVSWLREINGIDMDSDDAGDQNFYTALAQISLEPPTKTYRRASLVLTGKIPSTEKLSALKNVSDQALRNEILLLMQEQGFREFIKRGANDRLLVRGANELGDDDIYDIIKPYYTKLGDVIKLRDDEGYPGYSQSIEEEPLELIAHVVMNNRPYSEILTADYTMVDKTLNVLYQSNVDAENGWVPAKNRGQSVRGSSKKLYDSDREIEIPHAGILSSTAYNMRWPSTATNRNRARAKYIMLNFLGFDIEGIASREFSEEELADTNNPTFNNPACAQCHEALDPIAGTFQNVGNNGIFLNRIGSDGQDSLDPIYVKESPLYEQGDRWYNDMRKPGYYGMPSTNREQSLQWLAHQVVNDHRFVEAAVKFWWPALFGEAFFHSNLNEEQQAERQTTLENLSSIFNESNLDLKTLLVEMIMSPWYRAEKIQSPYTEEDIIYYTGGARLLTPEELSNKASSVSGVNIDQYKKDFNSQFGGIDSHTTTIRSREFEPLMYQVTQRVALDNACNIIASEFNKPRAERALFTLIDRDTPFDANNQKVTIKSQHTKYGSSSNYDTTTLNVASGSPIKLVLKEGSSREIYIGQFLFLDASGETVATWSANFVANNFIQEGSFSGNIASKHTESNDAKKLGGSKKVLLAFDIPEKAASMQISSWRKNSGGTGKSLSATSYTDIESDHFSIPDFSSNSEYYQQMAKLIERFHGQEVSPESDMIKRYLTMFARSQHNKMLRGASNTFVESKQYCTYSNPGELEKSVWAADPSHTLSPWLVVIATLMSGHHFIYE